MPIEIRELVVRARIDPGDSRTSAGDAPDAAERAREQEIVRACVQEALRVVELKDER